MSDFERIDTSDVRPADGVSRILRAAVIAALLLVVATTAMLKMTGDQSFVGFLFGTQDRLLLMLGGIALLVLSLVRFGGGTGVVPWNHKTLTIAVGAGAAVAYIGSYLVMERYGLSRDEQLADFAAEYLANGQLGRPIPSSLNDLAKAMMPLWADRWMASGYWVSNYLPVNSMLRAVGSWCGDRALTGPALLAIGAIGIWSTARRIWPARRDLATVAVVMALTSTQVLATAMTPYAMTGHFALSALWMACVMRGGRAGHGAAMIIGFFATGLHQFHYHPLFVSGFLVWFWWSGRRDLALLHAAACGAFILFWAIAYPDAMNLALGSPVAEASGGSLFTYGRLAGYVRRLGEVEYLPYLAKFIGWQNILLAPLVVLGTRAAFNSSGKPTVFLAMCVSGAIGLLMMVDQVHGWGVRYLHGLIPCFCLLAAAGWLKLEERIGRPVPGALLWASAAFALLVTVPIALWKANSLLHGYARAYRAVRSAPADIVVVDTRHVGFLQDIVRLDGPVRYPLVLDLAYVSAARLDWLCAHSRVMTFDRTQSERLGLLRVNEVVANRDTTLATRRRRMAELRCGTPVPLPND